MPARFGMEIRRLREHAGLSLRALAARLEVSPAHLSDVERNQRRPSAALLERIVEELEHAGADAQKLDLIATGLDDETRAWAAGTPGARAMLRRIMASGASPAEIIALLDRTYPG